MEITNMTEGYKRVDRLVTLIGLNPSLTALELVDKGMCGRWYVSLLDAARAGVICHVDGRWYLNQRALPQIDQLRENEANRLRLLELAGMAGKQVAHLIFSDVVVLKAGEDNAS
jgi:hypothetical protein